MTGTITYDAANGRVLHMTQGGEELVMEGVNDAAMAIYGAQTYNGLEVVGVASVDFVDPQTARRGGSLVTVFLSDGVQETP